MQRMGLSRCVYRAFLELLQQPVDVVELLLGAVGFARAPAQLFEDFARPRQIRLVRNSDVAAGHRSLFIERPPEWVELLAARLLALALLLAILRHHVLGELLSAVAQLIQSTLLVLACGSELATLEIVPRLAHRLAGIGQPLGHVDAVAAQPLDDLVQSVAQVLLVTGKRVRVKLAGPKLALSGLA